MLTFVWKRLIYFVNLFLGECRYLMQKFLPLINFLIAVLLFIGWQEQVCLLINKYLLPVTDIHSDKVWDGVFLLGTVLMGYGCRRMLNLMKVVQPIKSEGITALGFILFAYLYYRLDESVYCFTRFSVVEWVAYLDIPMAFCLALVLVGIYKSLFSKGTKSVSSTVWFSSDAPKKKLEQDVFAMDGQVTQMVDYLRMADVSERAFSIGVVGEWGDGKSTFFNFIKSELEKSDDLIWMDFFPRNSKDVSRIQEDFLNTLKKTLQPYYPHLSDEFSKYADALNVTVDVNPVYAFLWRLFKKSWETAEVGKEAINEIIKSIGKRIVVFVDDLDRLTAKELLEVLKVIDKNGSFVNMIFVSGYDKDYVNGALKGYLNYQEDRPYTDKYFELEIQLSKHAYFLLHNQLVHLLKNAAKSKDVKMDEKVLVQTLNNGWPFLELRLNTLRDVKRFVNQFLYDYLAVQDWVNLEDFFFLELIKYAHKEEYVQLRRKEFIHNKNLLNEEDDIWYLDIEEINKLSINEMPECWDILKHLFPGEAMDVVLKEGERRIYHVAHFDLYFYNNEYNHLHADDFNELYSMPLKKRCDVMDGWLADSKESAVHASDLRHYLLNLDVAGLGSGKRLVSYIQMLAYVNTVNGHFDYTRKLFDLFEKETYKEITANLGYAYPIEFLYDLRDALSEFFEVNPQVAACLFGSLTRTIVQKEFGREYAFSLEDLQKIARSLMNDYLHRIDDLKEWDAMTAYSLATILDKGLKYYKPALQDLREFMVLYPQKFMNTLMPIAVDSGFPYGANLSFDPHIYFDALFPKGEHFEYFIREDHSWQFEHIDTIRKFFILYKANNYEAVYDSELTGREMTDVVQSVDRCYKELDVLVDIGKKVKELQEEWEQKKRFDNVSVYNNRFSDLEHRMHGLKLDIVFREDILNRIREGYSFIAEYNKHACDFSENIVKGDMVRLDSDFHRNAKERGALKYIENVFKLVDVLPDGMIQLEGCMESVRKDVVKAIPIDGIADADIYYDPVIAASTVEVGQQVSVYKTDDSYYMDHFKKCYYRDKSYEEMVKERNFQFVHEVQHWLKTLHLDELKIKKSFLNPMRVSPQATVHKYS